MYVLCISKINVQFTYFIVSLCVKIDIIVVIVIIVNNLIHDYFLLLSIHTCTCISLLLQSTIKD